MKKRSWCAWDSNPGRQDSRRRRIHWAMAAPLLLGSLAVVFRKDIFNKITQTWIQMTVHILEQNFSAVWPDLAKFRHFGKTLQVFGNFWQFISHLHKMLCQLRQIYDIIGQIFIVANGQILKNNITIWPHWSSVPNRSILVRL